MLDIGSWEFLLIIVLGIVVIGPKELPGVIRTVRMWVRRAKDLAREFQGGLEDIARETEIDKFKSDLESDLGDSNSIRQDIMDGIDPDGDIAKTFEYEDDTDWYSDHYDDAEGPEFVGPPTDERRARAFPGDAPGDAPGEGAVDGTGNETTEPGVTDESGAEGPKDTDSVNTDAKTGA